jgi:hypothetical protein
MPNEAHLEVLRRGPEEWDRWRKGNPLVVPDLSGAELPRINLSHVDLNAANLTGAHLEGAVLEGTNLFLANLHGAVLHGVNLIRANLVFANLSQSDLTKATLHGADLTASHLIKAKLCWAGTTGADLSRANLNNSDLSGADLSEANLTETDLREANLEDTVLIKANLNGALLAGTSLRKAKIGWTTLTNVDLSKTIGLDTVIHLGPSDIGIDTIYRSKGGIPKSFLRKSGIPDNFITFTASLTEKAFELYSCFISFSNKDRAFVERLYADLENNGVRCWFAPDDLKIGDRFRISIDESIRIHDKLLLLLSKSSVRSDWVEKEVETAMEKERIQKRPVLFPVRLDDTVMRIESGWPADIRRTRHIGDFRRWKDPDVYKKAFNRLMHDLRAEKLEHPST